MLLKLEWCLFYGIYFVLLKNIMEVLHVTEAPKTIQNLQRLQKVYKHQVAERFWLYDVIICILFIIISNIIETP